MVRRALGAWLVGGACALALAGEPGQPGPERPAGPQADQQRQRAEMMRRRAMVPGVPPQVVQFWQEIDPDFLTELRKHAEAHPERRGDVMRKLFAETTKLQEMRQRDPEGFELAVQQRRLDRQVRTLGAELRTAKEQGERERIANELRATLDQLFEVRETLREREIKGLEEKIKELRALAKKRRDHKAEVIEHRIKQLSGQLDYLKW